MSDSEWIPTEHDFPKRKLMSDEQLDLLYYMLDISRDTTMDGSPRCESCHKGIDDYDQVAWMRCPLAAKLRVWITEEGDHHWELRCYGCCPHSDRIEELRTGSQVSSVQEPRGPLPF